MKYKIIEVWNDSEEFEKELNAFDEMVIVKFTQTHVSTRLNDIVYTAVIFFEYKIPKT